jgi:predicted nucleic acid-binding Zn ribbon protein
MMDCRLADSRNWPDGLFGKSAFLTHQRDRLSPIKSWSKRSADIPRSFSTGDDRDRSGHEISTIFLFVIRSLIPPVTVLSHLTPAMAIAPLDSILKHIGSDRIGQDKQWQQRQLLDSLQRGWADVVGEAVAAHAQPIALQRGTLQVATSSAVWGQNLSFERHRILRKLADRGWTIRNIQFSPSQWHERSSDPSLTTDQQHGIWKQHPSRLPAPPRIAVHEPSLLPESAFDRWSSNRRRQLQHLPLCPICKVPTPPGELDRWSRCSFCMSQRWGRDKLDNAARIDDTPAMAPPNPKVQALLNLAPPPPNPVASTSEIPQAVAHNSAPENSAPENSAPKNSAPKNSASITNHPEPTPIEPKSINSPTLRAKRQVDRH